MFVMSAVTQDLVANGATAMVMIDKLSCFNKLGRWVGGGVPSITVFAFSFFTFS